MFKEFLKGAKLSFTVPSLSKNRLQFYTENLHTLYHLGWVVLSHLLMEQTHSFIFKENQF